MKTLLKTYIMAHPPVVIPDLGRSESRFCQETFKAMQRVASEIKELKPERIIVVGPHGAVFSDAVSAYYKKTVSANFFEFGSKNLNMSFNIDLAFIDKLALMSNKIGVTVAKIEDSMAEHFGVSTELDHGASVPLYFVNQEYKDFDLVSITYGLLPIADLYEFGMLLKYCIDGSSKSTVLIISGDLSHCLSGSAPYDYSKEGKDFDRMTRETLLKNKPFEFLTYSSKKRELAQSCAYYSLCIMYGIFDGSYYKAKEYSYEAPFGVGYLVASLDEIDGISPSLLEKLDEYAEKKQSKIRESEDDYIRLARDTIEYYVMEKRQAFWDRTDYDIEPKKAGCFVSIRSDMGLRGCVGTVFPKKNDLFQEIVANSILACSSDDRFESIEPYELDELYISVDILSKPEPINSMGDLDPYKYGVLVNSGEKMAVLLPNLEGVNTAMEQLRIVLAKAKILPGENYLLSRFTVERHEVEY